MTPTIVFLDRATIPTHISFKPLASPCEWIDYDTTSEDKVVERAKDADIIITNKVPLTADTLVRLPKLKHIAVIATGFNNIDIDACKSQQITVSNTPEYSVDSVPEHTLAMMLTLRRHLFTYQQSMQAGEWQKSPYFHGYLTPIHDLKASQLGIIGGGSLGQATATLAKALGMKVVFAERKGQPSTSRAGYLPFDELIKTSDIISLHCPLTPETQNIIALDELKKMQPHALLINTARGGLVNEADLVLALRQGFIGGAGFDVASVEPIQADNPLLSLVDLTNFILTPHVAWSSESALRCQADIVIDNIDAFAQGRSLNRVV